MKIIFVILLQLPFYVFSGGIRGVVHTDDGAPLSYTSIFVTETGGGTVSDESGHYQISLPPGRYNIAFQYLGYQTTSRSIEVGEDFVEVDVVMKAQVMMLENVTVRGGKEDPAYTIMRRAIAKANYHTQQLDSYSAKVYLKGKGQLKDYPWLAKKAIEKEGITKDRVFITESVSEIQYTRPTVFKENVIAVFSDGQDNNTNPNFFVFGSFYEPEIAEAISPLSPKAFAYYRYEYLGTFRDQEYEISKIKVTPRSKGDDVFDGTIFIVEDWWSIHSLDLHVTKLGIDFHVKQIYTPVQERAWLPYSQQFNVNGKVFGFEFVYDYLVNIQDYKIVFNPELPVDMVVIDEKLEKEKAEELNLQHSSKVQQPQERLELGGEITDKELRKLVREYEKGEIKELSEPDVLSNHTYSRDSLAFRKDSLFWANIRPFQLTEEEARGYHQTDSLAEVERKREEGDTLSQSKNKGFQIWDILRGDNYRLSETSTISIQMPYGGFNAVEGFNFIYTLGWSKRWVMRDSLPDTPPAVSRLNISPKIRYAFSRQRASGTINLNYRSRASQITIEGGRYVSQFNPDNPIHPFVNTFTSLVLGDNYMKIYERDFVDLKLRHQVTTKYIVQSDWSFANRKELFNSSDFTFFSHASEGYAPNVPVNDEMSLTGFSDGRAFIGSIGFEARPWLKYRIRNGRKFPVSNSSPTLTADFRKSFDLLKSSIDFSQIEVGVMHRFSLGLRGDVDFQMRVGKFIKSDSLLFMDFKHFTGNRTPFVTTNPAESFRLLDYYRFSTKDQYLVANVHYHFRKLLITQLPLARLMGISENAFVNYLATPVSGDYTEIGYSLEGILRLFRLEGIAAFQDGKFADYGFRIGIATSLTGDFD